MGKRGTNESRRAQITEQRNDRGRNKRDGVDEGKSSVHGRETRDELKNEGVQTTTARSVPSWL